MGSLPESFGYVSLDEVTNKVLDIVEGELPNDIHGHVYIVAPAGSCDSPEVQGVNEAKMINPAGTKSPLMNGNAMVYRIDVSPTEAKISNKLARTPCWYADQGLHKISKALEKESQESGLRKTREKLAKLRFKDYGLVRFSGDLSGNGLGMRNQVNTAIIPFKLNQKEGYRLILTWDAGRPFEIDPVSLDVVTAVGLEQEWRRQTDLIVEGAPTKGIPFGVVTSTAHPVFDPDPDTCELYTVNYGKALTTFLEPMLLDCVDTDNGRDLDFVTRKAVPGLKTSLWLGSRTLLPLIWLLSSIEFLVDREFLPQALRSCIAQFTLALAKGVIILMRGLIIRTAFSSRHRDALQSGAPYIWSFRVSVRRLLDEVYDVINCGSGAGKEHGTQRIKGRDRLAVFSRFIQEIRNVAISGLEFLRSQDKNGKMADFVYLVKLFNSTEQEHSKHNKALYRWNIVDEDGKPLRILQSMHQIGMTRDFIVLAETVFKNGLHQLVTSIFQGRIEKLVRDLLDYRQGDKTRLYIIKRSELKQKAEDLPTVKAKRIEIERPIAHLLLDYDNPGDKIVLHCVNNIGWDSASWVRDIDVEDTQSTPSGKTNLVKKLYTGMATGSTDSSTFARYTIDMSGKDTEGSDVYTELLARDSEPNSLWNIALYAFCASADGITPPSKIRHIFWSGWGNHINILPDYVLNQNKDAKKRMFTIDYAKKSAVDRPDRDVVPATLVHLDTDSMTICQKYSYPLNAIGNSIQFIPRKGSQPGSYDGYLLTVVHLSNQANDLPGISQIWLFDAKDLERGPICKLASNEIKLGFTLHSTWIPTIEKRVASYRISAREDYDNYLVDEDYKQFFNEYVYSYYDKQAE